MLAVITEHLKVGPVLLVHQGQVGPGHLAQVGGGALLAGLAAGAARAGVDPPVDAGHVGPVRLEAAAEAQPLEQPVGVLLQGLQLQDGVVGDVAGEADLAMDKGLRLGPKHFVPGVKRKQK